MDARRTWSAVLFSLALVWAVALLGPAAAHHKSGHSQGGGKAVAAAKSNGNGSGGEPDGDADSDSGTSYTEDNDTNDGGTPNNQPDEGDNAHPSGKDRSVEHGKSGIQGKAETDPDDNTRGPERTNGGKDKANGPGGVDLADQDGNNGCGNDDDFEDDNEGWCGGNPASPPNEPPKPPKPPQPPEVKPDDEVRGVKVFVDATMSDKVLASPTLRPRSATLAASVSAGRSQAAPLPFTGVSIGAWFVVGLVITAGGLLMLKVRKAE